MKNQFTKKAETVAYCEQHCPKPYNERAAAVGSGTANLSDLLNYGF